MIHYTVFLFETNAFVFHFSRHESCILVFSDIIVKDMRFVEGHVWKKAALSVVLNNSRVKAVFEAMPSDWE